MNKITDSKIRQLLEDGLKQVIHKSYPQAVDNLLYFSEQLLEHNQKMNLTAITDPYEVVTRHFLDCAVLMPYLFEESKELNVIDIGTGAGFPGIPLAILAQAMALPISFTLLDAQKKRVRFLEKIISTLKLSHCQAIQARAEEFARETKQREQFHIVVSRAVAELRVLCELAFPLLSVGGVFLALKAVNCETEVWEAANAITVLGGSPAEIVYYTVPQTETVRAIIRIPKQIATPEIYPRRFKKIQCAPL